MSSYTAKIFLCLRWLLLLAIISSNTPICEGQQKICGKKLANVLDMMCANGFGRKVKKAIDPNDYYEDNEDDLPSPFEQLPFFSKVPASIIAKTRRRRHGVADECCKKACTVAELQSYCR